MDPDSAPRLTILELEPAARGSGAIARHEGDDLDVNLVRFTDGAGVAAHVNREVDVLIVPLAGEGVLESGDDRVPLRPGRMVLIPKGLNRSIQSQLAGELIYLTVHRRRARLMPRPLP